MAEKEERVKIKQYMYYFIIGVVSFIALVFLPMVGSTVGLNWNLPNTIVGWIVWVAVKLIVATINVLIFHSFMEQAKINIKDDENYKKAREILVSAKLKNVLPKSPKKWNAEQYGKKGTVIFITTALTTIALTQAILSFDYVSMLTYLFTIIMGLIFGVLQMKKAEEYWTDEYYRYALMIQENINEEKRKAEAENNKSMEMASIESAKQRNVYISYSRGVNILESSPGNIYTWDNSEPVVVDSSSDNHNILGRTIYPSSTLTDRTSIPSKKNMEEDKDSKKKNSLLANTSEKSNCA